MAYQPGSEPELFLGRGYTGHEHLSWFGLINMNARLYDPAVGRFLSPDPYVQSPDFTQNYNRYSYCLNNPLKYTDPNGEFIITAIVIGGAILGAYLGGASGNHGELNPTKWNFSNPDTYVGLITGATIGAVAAYGIAVPGSIAFSVGLFANNSLGGIALSLGGIAVGGSMSDWNFQWSTSAGGGGQYNFPDKNSSNKSNGSNHITNHNEQRNFERNIWNSSISRSIIADAYYLSGSLDLAFIGGGGFEGGGAFVLRGEDAGKVYSFSTFKAKVGGHLSAGVNFGSSSYFGKVDNFDFDATFSGSASGIEGDYIIGYSLSGSDKDQFGNALVSRSLGFGAGVGASVYRSKTQLSKGYKFW